ncbi:hypothetical protein BT96DRAFT_955644 [Gymnopus androsaceus JB14]|uniref:Glycoside hydrolase family 71 protein n=1 Tax=Gymnopus androsaceus JB14 TaxID=1447944 RepID=A0A6A4I0T8_9AGAR|nr:hypothetical protein BT96DRAFT_955644 [Gymnopus androsaceus JB14]
MIEFTVVSSLLLFSSCLLAASRASPAGNVTEYAGSPKVRSTVKARQTTSSKLVFAHFIIGIVSDRTSSSDYDADFQRAQSFGIDAFALDIGTDEFTDTQLGYAYESAYNNGMSVFISFDFAYWNPTTDAALIGQTIAQYASVPGSAFSAVAGAPNVYFAPNFHPGESDLTVLDGAAMGNNYAPQDGVLVTVTEGDQEYQSVLSAAQGYIAPVSPWFSTHYGAEVTYSKNFVFPSDLLWYMRWQEILTLQPPFVEIISWNDFGESHYTGPLSSLHTDDTSSQWVNDMQVPHDAFLSMAQPFIQAYKDGASSPDSYITSDLIVYWYRITSKELDCDATDTTMTAANNASGLYFGAGASAFSSFALSRDGEQVMSATSLKVIQDSCPCGIYNFNSYSGSVPAQTYDVLGPDGLANLMDGLLVACEPTPSLPVTPPATTVATATSSAKAAATYPPV